MAKSRKEKNYFLPVNFPSMHINNSNPIIVAKPKQMYWDGGPEGDEEDTGEGGGKGKAFMQGLSGMGGSGGVGTIVGNQINEKTTDEYGRQSSFNARGAGYWQGTSQGAMMGKSFGPWGMLIGAGIGGIAGGIGGAAGANKKNKLINEDIKANAGPAEISSANPYYRANGGPLDNMSGYNEFNGNTHEQGGIPLGKNSEVETGEVSYKNYIFSDRLGEGKSTYASQAKRIRNKYKGREDDSYAKTSMDKDLNELMVKNEKHRLAKEKEDIINNHVQALQDVNAYGGKIKCGNGGLLINEKHKKELDIVAKSRKMNVDDLIKEIHINTQKFAVGGVYQPQDQQSNFNQPTLNTAFSTQYGTSLPNNQDEKGIINQYGNGGNKNTNTYKQAQSDSLTLYNSGLNPSIPNFQYPGYNEAYLRLNEINHTPPTPLSGEQGINSKFAKPTMLPYVAPNNNEDTTKKQSIVFHPNYNQSIDGIQKSKFVDGGFDEENPLGYRPTNKFEQNKMYQMEYNKMNPQFAPEKQGSWITDQMLQDNSGIIENTNKKDTTSETKDTTDYSQYNLDSYNKDLAEALKRNPSDKSKKKFEFGNEEQALLASNIPALYNLAMSMKPSTTKFENVKPELLSLQNQRDIITSQGAVMQKIALENARNTGGGSGSILASLATSAAASNAQIMNALRDSYQQESIQNNSIKNQANYHNNQLRNNAIIANEQNKAKADNVRGIALSDVAMNTQGYLKDKKLDETNKKSNQQTLDIINQITPNYQWGKDPESDKYMIQYISSIGKKQNKED